ncbi:MULTISPECIES: DEAD/DEAH box helicase [Actinosynnema]|uniref:DEAD/DEAH box helicase n=1 Tax=Actinosynnema TaxID=40566 RepID=UPI0020A5D450|nr:DEAD/DEAH box helicase [Actinosynnema pretiosum]MCP2096766.1 Helicase conserved C-terminal domain-containing protein [Actinosynnema pretiosum]
MIRFELHQLDRPVVLVEAQQGADSGAWARLQEAFARGVVDGSPKRMHVRVDVFFAELHAVRDAGKLFRAKFDYGPNLREHLGRLSQDRKAREAVLLTRDTPDLPALADELRAAGFLRELKPFQLENLATITALPHGADFSVPGAGKTTVALANFALARARGQVDRLVVIAPIAAFQSWKEDSAVCLSPAPAVVVHGGPNSFVPDEADIVLTNYNRVASDYDRVRDLITQRATQVVLDEAHRIKRGDSGVHGRAVLDLAYAADRRDVLTGTPAPQGAYDLIALVRFLYPGQDQQILPPSVYSERDGREDHVLRDAHAAVARYFVRTPKSGLGLPPTEFEVVSKPMGPIQKAIYEALLGRYRGTLSLDKLSRREFVRLGRIMMYLLEAATNPMLLVAGSDEDDESGFEHPPLPLNGDERISELLNRYREYETPWKYEHVRDIVSDAASRGEKVIVWSTFIKNLHALSALLSDHSPAMVHGGVPPVDSAPAGARTREGELDRFRDDPECHVLLANPAACGEGVSLHHWCHHAVYLDRTFNAGHYLQSQDRIHRLGLAEGVTTKFTLLLSRDSIDEVVNTRLREKVTALATLMDDPGLVQVALPEPDADHSAPPATEDDVHSITKHVQSGG